MEACVESNRLNIMAFVWGTNGENYEAIHAKLI